MLRSVESGKGYAIIISCNNNIGLSKARRFVGGCPCRVSTVTTVNEYVNTVTVLVATNLLTRIESIYYVQVVNAH